MDPLRLVVVTRKYKGGAGVIANIGSMGELISWMIYIGLSVSTLSGSRERRG